jgi:hypothetical protein
MKQYEVSMKKAKYYANYSVNNGTSLMKDLEFTNKRIAIREILRSAKANHFGGTNPGRCSVYDADGRLVAERTYIPSSRNRGNGGTWVNTAK